MNDLASSAANASYEVQKVTSADHIFFIAEIGINHNGDLDIVRQLIDAAKDADCDAVKFQKRTLETVCKDFLDSPRESPWGTTQREQKAGLELNEAQYCEIDAYCREKEIEWFASAWDIDSQNFLKSFDLKFNKVASAMTQIFLLEVVAAEKRHTFISTGMCELSDIDKAVELFPQTRLSVHTSAILFPPIGARRRFESSVYRNLKRTLSLPRRIQRTRGVGFSKRDGGNARRDRY